MFYHEPADAPTVKKTFTSAIPEGSSLSALLVAAQKFPARKGNEILLITPDEYFYEKVGTLIDNMRRAWSLIIEKPAGITCIRKLEAYFGPGGSVFELFATDSQKNYTQSDEVDTFFGYCYKGEKSVISIGEEDTKGLNIFKDCTKPKQKYILSEVLYENFTKDLEANAIKQAETELNLDSADKRDNDIKSFNRKLVFGRTDATDLCERVASMSEILIASLGYKRDGLQLALQCVSNPDEKQKIENEIAIIERAQVLLRQKADEAKMLSDLIGKASDELENRFLETQHIRNALFINDPKNALLVEALGIRK